MVEGFPVPLQICYGGADAKPCPQEDFPCCHRANALVTADDDVAHLRGRAAGSQQADKLWPIAGQGIGLILGGWTDRDFAGLDLAVAAHLSGDPVEPIKDCSGLSVNDNHIAMSPHDLDNEGSQGQFTGVR